MHGAANARPRLLDAQYPSDIVALQLGTSFWITHLSSIVNISYNLVYNVKYAPLYQLVEQGKYFISQCEGAMFHFMIQTIL